MTRQRVSSRFGLCGRACAVGVVALVGMVASAGLRADQAPSSSPAGGTRTVWDGVFTAGQAERGRLAYQQHCAHCHGGTLNGGEAAPLTGDRFNLSWRESSVDRLFKQISTNMPASEDGSLAGTLSRGVYIDIVAFMLNSNGFPSGAAELTPESAAGVAILAKTGPAELPHSANAQVVGCLTRVQPRGWKVTRGSRPVRSGPLETVLDAKAALGEREFPLLFVLTSLDRYENHRVLVTGRLDGEGGTKGINVSTVASQGAACQ